MSMDRKEKIEKLMKSMRAIRRHMTFGASGTHTARITSAQWGVLMLVRERGECSVKDIAGVLQISSSAATQLVNGLIQGGHLLRKESPRDRRAVALSLSKTTKAKMDNMKKMAMQKMLKLLKALDDKELERYVALNQKIAQAFIHKN